jgi:ABC-type amino acid transport substrate-binding protein
MRKPARLPGSIQDPFSRFKIDSGLRRNDGNHSHSPLTGFLMVTLEFHDPSGALEVSVPFAKRLDTLEGKRIGIVTNDQWQAYRMMPALKAFLEKDFPNVEVLPVDAYPQGNLKIGTEETAAAVKKSGVDAVIVGNAS